MTNNRTDIDLSAILGSAKPKKHNSLGRGISALIADAKSNDDRINAFEAQENQSKFVVIDINIDDCVPSRYQARKEFNLESLNDLSNSIKEKGVLQPIVVRKLPSDKYEIVAGERRCRASKIAGLSIIPAVVMDLDDRAVMEIGLIENLQRKDLNPVEEASAYKSLSLDFNYTHEEIATLVGKSRSYISNFLRVLTLPEEVIKMITDGVLTMGHAKMLVNVANPVELANQIVSNELNVDQTETLAKTMQNKHHKIKESSSSKVYIIPEEITSVVESINADNRRFKLNLKKKTTNSGELVIKYADDHCLKVLILALNDQIIH
jgi:ParB family transcriptional regulator, chromosome partitioning protein